MGSIQDRNGMDLTEAEDIKKRWQEYTELYRKDLNNHDGVITHLEPDILECQVKLALGSNTTGCKEEELSRSTLVLCLPASDFRLLKLSSSEVIYNKHCVHMCLCVCM